MGLFSKKERIGLALSGGAVRGFAHLGALQALDEAKVHVDIIAGTSAGSLVGAFYLDGYSPKEILEIFTAKKLYELLFLSLPKSGLLRTDGLKKLLKKHLKATKIEDLDRPMIITATDFSSGKVKYFSKGPLRESLLASAGIPVLFEVITIDSSPFIDGGVMDNLPVDPLRDKCKKLIAVHVNPIGKVDKIKGPMQVAERAFHLAIASEIQRKKELADLFIEPEDLAGFGMFDLKQAEKIYKIGYDAARHKLSETQK